MLLLLGFSFTVFGQWSNGQVLSSYFDQTPFCNRTLSNVVNEAFWTNQVTSLLSCFDECNGRASCKTAAFDQTTNNCRLYQISPNEYDFTSVLTLPSDIYHMRKLCENGGSRINSNCVCIGGYVGPNCEKLMMDCSEGFESGHYTNQSGIFQIQPTAASSPFEVVCRMQEGGYTLIQLNDEYNTENFNQSWEQYKQGFGSLNRTHWLGLDHIHDITSSRTQDAYVYIVDVMAQTPYLRKFVNFRVENESMEYAMYYSSSEAVRGFNDLGDSLYNLVGQGFTTYDHDNDQSPTNCAQNYEVGFWYNWCALCNINGRMGISVNPGDVTEAHWLNDLGSYAVIKHIEIRLKRKKYDGNAI
ncbi:hypothetical protein SNE40_006450 [Patella caerulea]|uniref:Uncharacterized protein n=1 Tax=Patella caerulea TaxID=87958 RepID=A0AAN8Q667_PATCE